MKTGFLTSEYPGTITGSAGGIGTSIKNLATAFINKGSSVMIFIYGQDKDEMIQENGIQILRIKNVHLKGISWWLTQKKIERLINEQLSNKKIDVLEVADWTGISSFMNIKCPVIMRLHGSDTFFCHLDKRPVKPWNKFMEKRAYKRASAIIAVSRFVGEKTNGLFNQHREFKVIPNGINLTRFSKGILNDQQNNQILYFGTLIRKKGVLELPLIFNKVYENLPGATMVLAGADAPDILSGSTSTWELMKPLFSKDAMQQVSWLGKIAYDEMNHLIRQAGVCVFPSYAEACPVSWLEAMAMEKAIVASNIGWAPEIINDGSDGILVYPGDHSGYAKKIIELLTDNDLKKNIGTAAGVKIRDEFSNTLIAEKSLAFYSSVINN